MEAVWLISVGVALCLVGALGVVLTLLTLPGIWIVVFCALLTELIAPSLLGWWTIGTILALAVLAEVVEFFASAAGSKKAGGTKHGMWGSIAGSLVGLVVGQILIPVPLVGAVFGAVVGAGVGALLAEMVVGKRSFKESYLSGRGAATGRAVAVVVKGAFAVVVAIVVVVGVIF